ncbi:hypothetical protein VTI74DRAFT_6447 [Chaetomium olivicolor]
MDAASRKPVRATPPSLEETESRFCAEAAYYFADWLARVYGGCDLRVVSGFVACLPTRYYKVLRAGETYTPPYLGGKLAIWA